MKKLLISIFCLFLIIDTFNAFILGETLGLSSATTHSGRKVNFDISPIEYSVVMIIRLIGIIGCIGTVCMKDEEEDG